jgi:hypothetical protein
VTFMQRIKHVENLYAPFRGTGTLRFFCHVAISPSLAGPARGVGFVRRDTLARPIGFARRGPVRRPESLGSFGAIDLDPSRWVRSALFKS